MHKFKKIRNKRKNIQIFMWFDKTFLRPCLQPNQAQGYHYPSLLRLQDFTIDFQDVNKPLQGVMYTLTPFPQVFPILVLT